MNEVNKDIRMSIAQNMLKYWQVAEAVGISNSRFSVWLRTPLCEDRKKRVEKAIDELTIREGE
ncbi:hypothetical protein KVJ46_001368 [Enterococcus faecalis]|uniref:hypothetical protein n=1 Tax=Enterococcus faecalis TaxID=1351 RepID=UPI00045BA5BA|nr:hypothetical protein [Enterococcus faecalis]EGO9051639.1 hypothetical protein [Enterococcus faecalis]EHH3130694.1 hypothetical protein [Enterococcus faecalis]EHS2085479.1 hypothetical protein [Enterococcus faecalis]KAJ61904.1 hypothetical protein P783_0201 [Enterococcus faecalis GA2]HAP2777967.1 hypothetical protein [Enterococcus faecalis]